MDRNTHITRGQLAPIRSDDLDVTNSPSLGQVPSLGADGQFTWITPIILVDNFTIINNAGTLKIADRIEQNIMLLAFYRAIDQSKIIYNLVDGFIDEYEDESGIDTVNSINQLYNSSDDYYSPVNIPLKEIDYMEYATDETAQSNYVTDDAGGVDSYAKLLLHGNGSQGDTSFIDEIGKSVTNTENYDSYTRLMLHLDNNVTDKIGKTVTNNNVTFSNTAGQYKWGYSGIFNGSTSYLTVPESTDWDFGSGDFTIDFWIRFDVISGWKGFISQWLSGGSDCAFFTAFSGGTTVYFSYSTNGSNQIDKSFSWSPSIDTYYHLAFVRYGNDLKFYVDGIQTGATGDVTGVTIYNSSRILEIGRLDASYYVDGFMDEIRVSKGIARWTSNFTVPPSPYGQVYVDTSIKKFGTGSARLGNSGECLSLADSADWNFGAGDFTIDGWIYPISNAPYAPLIGQGNPTNNAQWFFTLNNGVPYFYTAGDFGGNDHNFGGSALSLNTWAHLAFVRASGVTTCYVNGIACPNTDNFITWYDVAYPLVIGAEADDPARRFNGYIDEIRVSKGIARWTSNFTPPTNEYGAETLQSYSEGTIKQQGSYSLKGIANITDSLNKTLTKTLTGGSKKDLSGIEDLVVYVRATRTGENLQLQFHDSGGTTSTFNITINSANTWEQKTLDISGISNANKNDIDKIIIKILNSDAENTFYIDDFKSVSIMLNMTLISDVVVAEAEPSQTRIVLFEEDVDAITLNTDLKVYASIDGGSNYDQITLSDEGDWNTGKRILSGIVDVSARTGTNIKYKAITYNEKNLKLHGVTQSWA